MAFVAALLTGLVARDTCRAIQANPGDGCWDLAKRCDISQDELSSYNSEPFSCKSIKAGDYVCCSMGTLPDFSPQPQENGECASYMVRSGDTCSSLAAAKGIKDWRKIETFNNETWGWAGCNHIQAGQNICVSSGAAPFPAPVKSAVCGPQVADTQPPDGMSPAQWAALNPCPLNACCNVWGQCGISEDFCTTSPADIGAPGTTKPGTNGCISNCGTGITNNQHKVGTEKRIGYFESWNELRPCAHLDISDINTDRYTHVHFAFANLSAKWVPDISGEQRAFEGFKDLKSTGRVLSFGGWAFSTDPATYQVFRSGVQPANRQVFAKNVVDFIEQHGLDGVDFDWEYPGAQDIPGIPADSRDSGRNYLEFLKLVKAQLKTHQTLSIAAPASYWYLKGFPISEISSVVDYIVYMAYDLHGQWDYGNKYVNPGCPGGNCLRHQVNDTEVHNSLAMVTKAGVPANKIVVGMPLYGRSFRMAEPHCVSANCTFTGPKSGAPPGRCTKTAGYLSNLEIYEMIKTGHNTLQYYDHGDILVVDDTEWIAWLAPETYAARQALLSTFNFAGTSDWAIDLNGTSATSPISDDDDTDGDYAPEDKPGCDYTLTWPSLDQLNVDAPYLRRDCLDVYTLQVLMTTLDAAYENYTRVDNGYDEMFEYYTKYMKKLVPKAVAREFMFNDSAKGHSHQNPPPLGFGMGYFDCKLGDGTVIPCSDFDDDKYTEIEAKKTTALTLRDHEGYVAGLAKAGLEPDWVDFGHYHTHVNVEHFRSARTYRYKFSGFPVENSSMVVPNPKDLLVKGLRNIPELQNAMAATYIDMLLGQWTNGSTADAAQAYSAPVFMLMQGIDSMQQAKTLGEKEKKEEEEEEKRKKDFILLLVSMVLMFVPIIGEELAVASGLATLARAIAIAGEAGNAALAIYDTVDDPQSAVINILGMLLGVGAIARVSRDGKGIGEVAKIRRSMKAEKIASMGTIFKNNDDTLQLIAKSCKLK